MTYDEAASRIERMHAILSKLSLYIVASPDGEHDVVAVSDWDTPHERNNLTPRRKETGWTVAGGPFRAES
jgi:hypothetical protein